MNNKEKREYINCLELLDQNCFSNEIQKTNQVLSKCPNTLYKYRSFDKYAFEMIKDNYAYLSPVKDLDDPFDCIVDFDSEKRNKNEYDNVLQNTMFEGFDRVFKNSAESIGILSLSETRNNKVMWSLYGNKYSGYCIEYEIPINKKTRRHLYPVIYDKNASNNINDRKHESFNAQMRRNIYHNPIIFDTKIENVGSIYELFCTKDSDWKYQKEWRLIGEAGYRYSGLKIKSIYLGFKVSEDNETRMKRYAKKFGFNLFKMDSPNGKKKLTYKEVI